MISPLKAKPLVAFFCSLAISAGSCQLVFSQSSQQGSVVKQSSTTSSGHRVRVGLALGGGGSRGSAEVGVLKVLKEEGIPIDIIAGTSIGSIVGGLYSAGVPLDKLEDVFKNDMFIKQFMPLPIVVRALLVPVTVMPRLFGHHPYDGLYKSKKTGELADKLAGSSNCAIERLPITFAAVCTNVVTGQSQRITEGDLGTALNASSAVPGLKKPVQIGNQLFCDGGLIRNLPVKHVRDMGADFVIAVNIDEELKDVPLDKFRALGSVSRQALRIQLADGDEAQSKFADVVIHPDTTGITLISRNKHDAQKGMEAGIKAAREAMPELKRKLAALGVPTTK